MIDDMELEVVYSQYLNHADFHRIHFDMNKYQHDFELYNEHLVRIMFLRTHLYI